MKYILYIDLSRRIYILPFFKREDDPDFKKSWCIKWLFVSLNYKHYVKK